MRTLSTGSGAANGSALVTAAVVTAILGTLAWMLASFSVRLLRESTQARGELRSFHAAEAGLSRAWVELRNGGDGAIGSAERPDRIGGVDYWVAAKFREDGLVSLTATARADSRTCRLELTVHDRRGEVDDFGVFAQEQVTLWKYCAIDSYDSSLGSYAFQVQSDHARDDGNVGSNGDIQVSPYARVWGYTQHGPDDDDSITIAPGMTLWDGFGAALNEVPMLPVTVPSHASQGDLVVEASEPRTVGPGAFEFTSLITRRHAELTVAGPCDLVITTDVTIQRDSTWSFDTTHGPIRVYALGDFRLERNATLLTTVGDPARLSFFLCGVHDFPDDRTPLVHVSANAQFHGTLYAPGLSLLIENRFELFGSVKAKWLQIGSGARVHFDESLASGALDPGAGYAILGWRQLEGAQAPTE